MKIIVEFDSLDEYEQFRVSGKATRQRKKEDDEAASQPVAQAASPAPAAAQQTFTPPATAVQGFPGGGPAQAAAPPPHPLVIAINAKIDQAVASGQSADAIVNWFRQHIGAEAADATLDQIKNVFIPRLTEVQLKQIAPQLGITG